MGPSPCKVFVFCQFYHECFVCAPANCKSHGKHSKFISLLAKTGSFTTLTDYLCNYNASLKSLELRKNLESAGMEGHKRRIAGYLPRKNARPNSISARWPEEVFWRKSLLVSCNNWKCFLLTSTTSECSQFLWQKTGQTKKSFMLMLKYYEERSSKTTSDFRNVKKSLWSLSPLTLLWLCRGGVIVVKSSLLL